jgi:hypothetical protein
MGFFRPPRFIPVSQWELDTLRWPHDLPKSGAILVAFTDNLGRVWFGYAKSELAVLDGGRVRRFGPSDDLQVGNITAIYGRGREIWIGGEFGLEQFDQGRFHKIAAMDDRWLRGISGIAETSEGDLWLNAVSGIFHIRKTEISEALKDSAYRVKGEHFGRRDGLPGIAAQLRPLPTAIEARMGDSGSRCATERCSSIQQLTLKNG